MGILLQQPDSTEMLSWDKGKEKKIVAYCMGGMRETEIWTWGVRRKRRIFCVGFGSGVVRTLNSNCLLV